MSEIPSTVRYRVTGVDCTSDAAEIEAAARSVDGVQAVKVSTALHVMSIQAANSGAQRSAVEEAVTRLGY